MGDVRQGRNRFRRLLTQRRHELGLSRRELAEASGLSYPYVSQLETGKRLPSHKSVGALARALQMAPADLAALIPYDDTAAGQQLALPPATAAQRGGAWRDNPAFLKVSAMLEMPSDLPTTDAAVASATALLVVLPAEDRLDALAVVQRDVVQSILDEQRA